MYKYFNNNVEIFPILSPEQFENEIEILRRGCKTKEKFNSEANHLMVNLLMSLGYKEGALLFDEIMSFKYGDYKEHLK